MDYGFFCFFPESSQMISNTSVDSCDWEVTLVSMNNLKQREEKSTKKEKREKKEVNAYDNTVLGIWASSSW